MFFIITKTNLLFKPTEDLRLGCRARGNKKNLLSKNTKFAIKHIFQL